MAQASALQDMAFSFSAGESVFSVVDFKGTDAISQLFHFGLNLTSPELEVNVDGLLQARATFTVARDAGQPVSFEGVLSSVEQSDTTRSHAIYRATLVPRLWLLTQTRRSRIFQDQTIQDTLAEIFKEHGFTTDDYALRLTQQYPRREYAVQYEETDFAFVSRWMEHEGIFYFFDGGTLIVADDASVHRPIEGTSELVYRTASGMHSEQRESVFELQCRRTLGQERVVLNDYNWRRPGLALQTQQNVAGVGRGVFVEYGDHYKDTGEGARLAKVRSEAIESRKRRFVGKSDCRGMRAGLQYSLVDHGRADFNARYLITQVTHEGRQSGTNADGLVVSSGDQKPNYQNAFHSIPADTPFRPRRQTRKPRLHGTMNAKIDGAADGQYAEIDSQGRYKVILPFDLSAADAGKASRFIRMAQPYAGADYGMHFPLHKGTEVIITCIDGDLDRPIICGAVPNADTASPVTDANHTTSVIRDYARNELVIDGTEGKEQIRLHSPNSNTTLQLGGAITVYTDGPQNLQVQGKSRSRIGQEAHTTVGGNVVENFNKNHALVVAEEQLVQAKRIIVEAQDELCLKVGGSFITIRGNHIAIEGAVVDINGGDTPSTSSLLELVSEGPSAGGAPT